MGDTGGERSRIIVKSDPNHDYCQGSGRFPIYEAGTKDSKVIGSLLCDCVVCQLTYEQNNNQYRDYEIVVQKAEQYLITKHELKCGCWIELRLIDYGQTPALARLLSICSYHELNGRNA